MKSIWASMLNRRAKPGADKILESLQIKQGDVIADIGSGGGFYSMHFSTLTSPDGKVYAVDTDEALLACLHKKIKKKGLDNIETIVGENISNLPRESCDLIFMRNVFHHILNPELYFNNLKASLKPKGRIAIIEWKPGGMMWNSHCTLENKIVRTLEDAGYRCIESYGFLKSQSYNIFQKTDVGK